MSQIGAWYGSPAVWRLVFALALVAVAPGSAAAQDQNDARAGAITFDIPAQSLARALIAFGTATGIDLYYDAALADGRLSTAVTGTLPPRAALQQLLQGTGVVARVTAPETFILVPAPREARAPAPARYQGYFAAVQARVGDALCRGAGAAAAQSREALLRLWLTPAGTVDSVEVLGAASEDREGRGLADAMRGLAIGAPPADMPQPITVVVFPRSAARRDCSAAADRQRAN